MPWPIILKIVMAALPVEKIVAIIFDILLEKIWKKKAEGKEEIPEFLKSARKVREAAEAFSRAAESFYEAAKDDKISKEEAEKLIIDVAAIKQWSIGAVTPEVWAKANRK